MDVASTIGQTGQAGMIHISNSTANCLIDRKKTDWIKPREGKVHIEGKGDTKTFYAAPISIVGNWDAVSIPSCSYDDQVERLVEWNTDQLLGLLENLVSSRNPGKANTETKARRPSTLKPNYGNPIEEITELVSMPAYEKGATQRIHFVDVGANVKSQLHDFVAAVAGTYNRNAFHNFEHASHVSHWLLWSGLAFSWIASLTSLFLPSLRRPILRFP